MRNKGIPGKRMLGKRILGIDPGLQKTGWGIIESDGAALKYIACGMIKSNSKEALPERLKALHNGMGEVIKNFNPDLAAMEETFVNKNAVSSLKLGHARGALMISVSMSEIPLAEYAATAIKKAITGAGRAEKGQIENMVKILLPKAEINTSDEADALATAICHAHHSAGVINMRASA